MTRRLSFLALTCVAMLALGCHATENPADGAVMITGRLVAVKDDRPADGGVDLTVETQAGKREILRVGSAFIAGPREPVLALHAVVDSAKVGDRLRARGSRDESGALIVEQLENLH